MSIQNYGAIVTPGTGGPSEGLRAWLGPELIYRRFVNCVYRCCSTLLGDIKPVTDATLEVFSRLSLAGTRRWCQADSFDCRRELAIDVALRRKGRRRIEGYEGWAATGEPPPTLSRLALSSGPGHKTAESGEGTPNPTKHDAVSALPPDLRVALVLHEKEGLSDGAIASHLRITKEEVRRLIHLARLELRRMWSRRNEDKRTDEKDDPRKQV